MIKGYDIDSLALIYLIFKCMSRRDGIAWFIRSFEDVNTGQWYSADDFNKIINN